MIRLEGVSMQFPVLTAVNDISLHVQSGEIFGLVGPDGAGKTTLMRMILGLITPTAGAVQLLGSADAEAVKEQLGYVPQKFSLYPDLTVLENIRTIGALYNAAPSQIQSRAEEILAFTNLLSFQDRLAANLSGGMKQKLSLAAGLMHKPRLFFLDEPTTGVDPVSRREFWQLLYRLNKEGVTVFVSTPYMDEAELCTRVAFMHQGRIISCAPPAQLKAQFPHHILELQVRSKDLRRLLAPLPLLDVHTFGDKYHLAVTDPAAATRLLQQHLHAAGVDILTLQEVPPTLEDVFVSLAREVG